MLKNKNMITNHTLIIKNKDENKMRNVELLVRGNKEGFMNVSLSNKKYSYAVKTKCKVIHRGTAICNHTFA